MIRLRRLALGFALAIGCCPLPAGAALSPVALSGVAATPAPGATVPLDLPFVRADGTAVRFRDLAGERPVVLLLADFRCTQLCGSVLGIAAQALSGTGLRAGRDFTFIVVDFNPDATAADGAALTRDQLDLDPDLGGRAALVTTTPDAVSALERAIGFTAVRDADGSRYAHPIDLFVLTPGGRVSRVLNGLSLDPPTLRLAMVEAGDGKIGGLVDHLRVLCYGLDPLAGASTNLAQWLLRGGASLTLLAGGALVAFAIRHRRPGATG